MARKFDLNLLPVLVAIHEHGSVSVAAQHLGMSQSAVSTALAKLRIKYWIRCSTASGMACAPRRVRVR
jgi:hypothetical protein